MEFGLRPAQQHTSPKRSNDDEMQGRNSFQQPYINLVRSCLLIRFFSFILQQFLLVHRTPLDLDNRTRSLTEPPVSWLPQPSGQLP